MYMRHIKNRGLISKLIAPAVFSSAIILSACSSGGGSSTSNNNGGGRTTPTYEDCFAGTQSFEGISYSFPDTLHNQTSQATGENSIDGGEQKMIADAHCNDSIINLSNAQLEDTSCDTGYRQEGDFCIVEPSSDCEAGEITINGVTFNYQQFKDGETQNVLTTQNGTYENTNYTDTLQCDDSVVSSQDNFNQTTTENQLGATLTKQYLTEQGYTEITDGSVNPEFWDINSSNELSFIKPNEGADYSIFQTTDLTPSYVLVVENANAQTKPHITNGEYSQNESYLTSQINPTQNESNISQVVTHPTTRSGIESKLQEISSNLQKGIKGAFYSFISSLEPTTNTSEARILSDGVAYTIDFDDGSDWDIYELNQSNRDLYIGEVKFFTDNSTQIPTNLYLTKETNADNLDTAEKFAVLYNNGVLSINLNNRDLTAGAFSLGENYRVVDADGVNYGIMYAMREDESCNQDVTKEYVTLFELGSCENKS